MSEEFLKGLTKEQIDAIKSSGNVLVSAGAGSGKTSVLTKRVLYNLLNGVQLDELLILTFTNNAANEMKERIKNTLSLYEKTKHLVPFVDSANITTFDAYFLYLVKKYSYVFNIDENIINLPEDILKVKKHEVLEEIINKYYEDEDENLIKIIKTYTYKNDSNIFNFILKIDDLVSKNKNKFDFLNNYYNNFLSDEALKLFKDNYLNKGIQNRFEIINDLLNLTEEKYHQKFNEKFDYILSNPDFDYLASLDKKFASMPYKSLDNNSNTVNQIVNLFKNQFLDILKEVDDYQNIIKIDKENNQKLIPFLIKIVYQLEVKIDQFKKDKQAYTFNDIAIMAKELLLKHEDIRNEIKTKLRLIMIDEYQDTSKFQEEFIDLIANNNVFVVGDVKQSIYGFRDANPKQFIDKYELYKNDPSKGQLIIMNKNFRSRKEINIHINELFSNIMSLEYGGADYKVDHQIETGNDSYEKYGKTSNKHGITSITYKITKKDRSEAKVLKEINTVILDIKSRVYNKMQIFDKDKKILRDVRFSDFTLLSPKSTRFKDIEKLFILNGVPINAIYDEDIIQDESIITLISILKFINETNKEEPNKAILKHAFYSIARSFLFSYKDKKLYNLSLNDLYQNDELYLRLEGFSNKNKGFLIQDLFLNIIKEFDFLDKLTLIGDSISKIKFTKIFYEKTKIMDELNYSLDDFISYLEKLDSLDLKMESRKVNSGIDAVGLTTIHKSKGLEYPIVYLVCLDGKDNNKSDVPKIFFANDKFGFFFPSLFTKSNKNIHQLFSSLYMNLDTLSEKIRLLYVALTRAKEEAIIPNCIVEDDEGNVQIEDELNEDNELYGVAINSFEKLKNAKNLKNIFEAYELKLESNNYYQKQFEEVLVEEQKNNLILKMKGFDFNFIKEEKIKASKKLNQDTDNTLLEIGTRLHLLMEVVNFKTKDLSFIRNENDKKLIKNILDNQIFASLENSKIYKEYEYYDNEFDYSGIIDLMIEDKNHIKIIDYKLKNIDDENYTKQLTLYKNYIEKTFNKKVSCYLLSLVDNNVKVVYE